MIGLFRATVTKADGSTEQIEVYAPLEKDLPILDIEKRGRGWKQGNPDYLDAICCLDTETSKKTHFENGIEIADAVWIYQWCMSINDTVYAGRTAQDLIGFLRFIYNMYELGSKRKLAIYVHNMAYDISYLLNGLYPVFEEDVKIFATGQRRPLKVTLGKGLEIRCSWKLTNKGLDAWGRDLNTEHQKAEGEVDYNILRTPGMELTDADWDYMINDVLTMRDCLREVMKHEKYRTIPMTSTGFVRRPMRYAARNAPGWNYHFKSTLPTAKQYILMKKSFWGGYTHANSFAISICHDGEGWDAASMYPAMEALRTFPDGRWTWRPEKDIDSIDRLCNDPTIATCLTIVFDHIFLRDMFTWNPYIPFSKCDPADEASAILDNGKLISCDRIQLSMTDVDYRIIMEQYDFEWCAVLECMTSRKKPLPKWYLDTMRDWYCKKTMLKGAKTEDERRRYMESKQYLNACYG